MFISADDTETSEGGQSGATPPSQRHTNYPMQLHSTTKKLFVRFPFTRESNVPTLSRQLFLSSRVAPASFKSHCDYLAYFPGPHGKFLQIDKENCNITITFIYCFTLCSLVGFFKYIILIICTSINKYNCWPFIYCFTFYLLVGIFRIYNIVNLVGLGVSMSNYWSWGRGFDPGTSTNFKCELGLERGPTSVVRTIV